MPPKTIDALGAGPSDEFVRAKEIREKLASLELDVELDKEVLE